MKKILKFWPFILISIVVLFFFSPIFKGFIPFPGDLLVNTNPYKSQSFLGYQAGAYPNKAQGPDVIYEIYPWRYFSIEQLKAGEIPFWNPYNFSGNPQMADFQTAVFYPFNFIYFLLPFNFAWTLIIMLQPFLAALFMYLFLKKGLGIKDFASVLGGISFAFCSYITVWIEYGNIGSTLLWLPLALLFTKFYFNKCTFKNFAGLSVVLVFAILAGYIQGAFYIYTLCFFYYLYLVLSSKGALHNHKKNFLFLISLSLPLLITAFQILPTLNVFTRSTREGYTLLQTEKNLLPIKNLITMIVPDFFGNPATRNYWVDGTYIERVLYPGAIIFFFAFYALLNRIKNITEKKFFTLVSFVSLIVALNVPFIKYLYLIPIPVISTTVPTRELSIFIFALIVLGAIGIEELLNQKNINKKIVFAYSIIFVLIWGSVLLLRKIHPELSGNLEVSMRNLILPTIMLAGLIAAIFIKKFNTKLTMFIITIIIIFDLLYFFNKITPFSPSSFTYPDNPVVSYLKKNAGIYRFWGYGSAYVPANYQTVDRIFSPEGNDPLHLTRYSELLSSSYNGKPPDVLPRPDANIAGGYGSEDLKNNFFRKRVLDLTGVKYILDKQDDINLWKENDLTTYPKEKFTLVEKFYPWRIYENKNVVPRFFVTGDYVLVKNKQEALSLIYNPKINLSKTVILETPPEIVIDKNPKASAKLLSYKPNEVKFNVESSANVLLFMTDNYYSQWSVKIDGKPAKLMRTDYAYRSVAVPKGNHTVYFFYTAQIFITGLQVSAGGILALILFTFYVKKNHKKL